MSNLSTRDYLRELIAVLALGAVLALLFAIPAARAAAPEPPEATASIGSVVDGLVGEALRANLEIDMAGATVTERLAALDAARARYLPALDFNARYSAADGGRTIDVPVGDLLNPVYSTLNQLTGTSRFPSIANQEINFLRSREQDTKLTLSQPLYDARLGPARAAAAADYAAASATRSALASRIERDMRTAYYRWLEARARVGILGVTLELARENQRVNESLFKNGKITRDLVYRAEADVLEVEQTKLAAENATQLAQSYVNLIRNVSFDAPLAVAAVDDADVAALKTELAARLGNSAFRYQGLATTALDRRPELKELAAEADAAAAGEHLARAAFRPQLALAVDAGTQGAGYGFTSEDRYVLASVVLKFNLFAGGADRAGLAGARERRKSALDGKSLAEQRIRLEVQQALQDFEVAEASLGTAAKRAEAAAGAFRIAERKRDLGQINQAEFVDARRVLTDARLNLNVTRFTALGSLANLEYAVGPGRQPLLPESPP
jgi:outer membrane protein TolC